MISNAILLFGKQRNKPCLLPGGVFIYANLFTLQNKLAAFHDPINILLFYEMFVINVLDDFFYNCLLEIHNFLIKYLGITQFQVTRL